ncbi:restriction endonuclease [Streptomyces gobiensis]|uniref:restriction endonuclease n=1 Tax=Streptomyces gobiensis TaxID=2875706 RepID=UPI001E65E08F|nr:restriction endonuclease [Streptomyces gobiensis]UGY92528.1 restriction endonuclease [Streptomyces gobiensis]
MTRWEGKRMVHEGVLLESKTLRESVVERTEVLDKVKKLELLPDDRHTSTAGLAAYFEVGVEAIKSLVKDHRDELESNGYWLLSGPELRSFKDLCGIDPRVRSYAIFSRRAVLNVAMLLRDSEVARQVRTHLLDAEERHRAAHSHPPVDNLVHSLAAWLDEHIARMVAEHLSQITDERTVQIAEDAVRTVVGKSVVPLLNLTIQSDSEQRRQLSELREEINQVKRVQRMWTATGGMAAMDAMTWREFEDHIAGLCRRDGCVSVANTSANSDLSADLVCRTADGRLLVVQCKHFAPHRKVESGEMQKFIGMAKVEYEADVALFVTTSLFSPAALDLAAKHGVTAVHRGLLEAWSAGTRLQVLRPG